MSPLTKENLFRLALLPLTAAVLVATGCNGSMIASGTQSSASTGPAFVVGTDAPLASVVSFQVQITGVELTGSGGSAGVLVGTPTVDFARYNGLQGLVDMTDVTTGTYTGVTITLGAASLGYLNTTPPPPTISTFSTTATPTPTLALSTTTLNIPLDKPLVITAASQPVGLRMDFNLAQSIPNAGGNITVTDGVVTVTPTIDVKTVARTDAGAHIDWFVGGVVTPPTSTTVTSSYADAFVIQGPHGENFNIAVNSSTEWDGGASLNALETDGTSAVVGVAGQFDPADQTLDADEIAILTDSKFYADGMVTYVNPSPGTATAMDFYVRAVLPSSLSEVPLGGIADVTITGTENYGIYWMHNAFTQFLFNDSSLLPGQEITVGGADPTASPFDVKRIHLQNWGYNGTITATPDSGNGTFTMTVNGFAGVLIPQTVTVYLGNACDFRYGLGESGFAGLTSGMNVRVVGVLLYDSNTNTTVLLARHIDGLDFTDFTVVDWQ